MQGKVAVIVVGLVMVLAVSAAAQGDSARDEMRRRRGPEFRPRSGWSQESTARNGYVFINGALIASPYVIRQAEGQLTINGKAVASDPEGPLPPHEIAQSLENQAAFIAFDGQPIVLLQDARLIDCLRILSNEDLASRNLNTIFQYSWPDHVDRNQWRAWMSTYVLPEPVRTDALARVADSDAARVEGETVIAANQRLSTWAYPLTIFGMLMSVISFGHLLQFPPRGNSDLVPSRRRAELCRATVIFLVMVVILSSLDLVWTLLTSQAGQMNELNPIGRELLNDPLLLAIFKIAATLCSCGLLLMLRRHPRAQLASWWMCLVCTLVTFRWLVLNSMFVA